MERSGKKEKNSLMDMDKKEESLLNLEERVQKLLDNLARLKKEKAAWEEERAKTREKIEGILKRIEEITEE